MRTALVGIVLSLLIGQVVFARDPDKHGPSTAGPEDHTFDRAGHPELVSNHAAPSVLKHEGPGYIGGGKLVHGDSRGPADGTFGYDYQLFGHFPGRIFLGWAHDRDKQPRLGAYRTDTHLTPDIFSVFHAPSREKSEKAEKHEKSEKAEKHEKSEKAEKHEK